MGYNTNSNKPKKQTKIHCLKNSLPA